MATSNAAIPNLQGSPRAPSSASAVDSGVVVSSHALPRPRSSAEQASLLHKAVHRLQYYAPPIESVRTVLDDFQDFIQQGNMIDLAVGLILGKAFTDILNSFVVDILTPIISLFSERSIVNYFFVARCPVSLPYCTSSTWETWKQARDAGAVTINYGLFLENIVNFIINAIFLYVAIKKFVEVVFKRNVSVKKQCPFCKEFIKGAATVCKECGSQLTRPQQ
uniref:Large conductance mechanosensitive channel protein n=1 Tax=Globisporangium ultimum (strain ATCC 200006 / CBS 805.95 / DAOM BR144) TaxID=431595 RepID=K3X500_GLOUD